MKLEFKDYTLLSLYEHQELLNIRNSKPIRKNMKSHNIIKTQEHLAWVKSLITDTHNYYYAVYLNSIIQGAVYITDINRANSSSSWGLFFKKETNPFVPSLSAYLLINKVFDDLKLKNLNLEVQKSNTNAYAFDLHLGFKVNGEVFYDLELYYKMSMSYEQWQSEQSCPLIKALKKKLKKTTYQYIEKEI